MRNWRQIRSDIYDALSNYNVTVRYHKKEGSGWDGTCSYFSVSFDDDEEWDWDWIESDIQAVCDEWDLGIDDDSEDGDFDLNAYWDTND